MRLRRRQSDGADFVLQPIVRDLLLPVLFRADGTVAEGVNVATWRMKVHVLAGAAQVL